jgi:hypothetical protein
MDYSLVLMAAIGAIAINLLNLAEAHNLPPEERPNFKDILYWLSYVITGLIGAFVAYVYLASGFEFKALLAVHLGASSPLIIRAMASAIPKGAISSSPGA